MWVGEETHFFIQKSNHLPSEQHDGGKASSAQLATQTDDHETSYRTLRLLLPFTVYAGYNPYSCPPTQTNGLTCSGYARTIST